MGIAHTAVWAENQAEGIWGHSQLPLAVRSIKPSGTNRVPTDSKTKPQDPLCSSLILMLMTFACMSSPFTPAWQIKNIQHLSNWHRQGKTSQISSGDPGCFRTWYAVQWVALRWWRCGRRDRWEGSGDACRRISRFTVTGAGFNAPRPCLDLLLLLHLQLLLLQFLLLDSHLLLLLLKNIQGGVNPRSFLQSVKITFHTSIKVAVLPPVNERWSGLCKYKSKRWNKSCNPKWNFTENKKKETFQRKINSLCET